MRYAKSVLMTGLIAVGMHAVPAAAQEATPDRGFAAQQAPQQAPAATNVKLDLTITDTYGGSPSKKTVSMLVMVGQGGMIRTSNRLTTGADVKLNVDATVHPIREGGLSTGLMRVQITFEYTPAQARSDESAVFPAELHESLHVVLQNGKPLVVSQSADPATERRVTVELTGTILK